MIGITLVTLHYFQNQLITVQPLYSQTHSIPTLCIFIVGRDVHSLVTAHCLGADVLAYGHTVRGDLFLGAVSEHHPGYTVGVDFGEDKGHIVFEVNVTLQYCLDWSRAAAVNIWGRGRENNMSV